MTAFGEIIDYAIINEQYLEAYLEVRTCIGSVTGIEPQVIKAMRDKMNRIDWLTEKDATKKLVQVIYKVFGKYATDRGYRVIWDVGRKENDELNCRFKVEKPNDTEL